MFINPLWKQNIVLKPINKHLQRYLNCINYGKKVMNIVLTRLYCILKVNCTLLSNDGMYTIKQHNAFAYLTNEKLYTCYFDLRGAYDYIDRDFFF